MNAHPKFLSTDAAVDQAAITPLPNSRKIYVEGSRPDIRVPMREISQADTPASFGFEANPPVYVYDTSGPYTDPDAVIDIRCRPGRDAAPAVDPGARRHRGTVRPLVRIRPARAWPIPRSPSCASSCTASRAAREAGANVTQMHYARRGIITPEMEFVAIRENMRRRNTSNS